MTANATLHLQRCRNCGTEIDTGFLSHCPECGTPADAGSEVARGRRAAVSARPTPWPSHVWRWAVAALSGVVLVVTGALVGNPEVPRGDDGRVAAAVEADVAAVTVGDCVNLPPEGDDEMITTVELVPCSLPHQVEKYAEVAHPAGAVDWIGTTAIEDWATDACAGEFEAVFGRPSEEATHLRFSFVYPAPQAWATGDRLVQCFVMRADQAPLVEPVGVDTAG